LSLIPPADLIVDTQSGVSGAEDQGRGRSAVASS
jgi:hypothetical protein